MVRQTFIFTFGYDHKHPVTDESLDKCFLRLEGETYMQARETMIESFGRGWSSQYDSESAAGVKRFDLREIKFLTAAEITEQRLLRDVSELVNRMARPLWIYRAAHGLLNNNLDGGGGGLNISDAQRRSAQTRRRNAVAELDRIVRDYAVDRTERRSYRADA